MTNKKMIVVGLFATTVFMSGCAGKFANGNFSNKMFSKYDEDGSGFIEKKEYVDMAISRFDRSDSNEDGKVSKEELRDHRFAKFMPNFVDGYLETYDLNKDNSISRAEVIEQSKEEFKKADLDKDSKLSKNEIKDFRLESRFNSIDLNNDNMISKEEYKKQKMIFGK